MAHAAVLAAVGGGTGAGAAAGSVASSIMNTLVEIAKIIARFLLELMRWFREAVLSNPWRTLHLFGSMVILTL